MIDGTKLTDISYWLNPGPGEISEPYLIFFITSFGFFIFLNILLRFIGRQYVQDLNKAQQHILYRIETLLFTMGILGLFMIFFRYELVPFFSARIWFILWLLGFVMWAYMIFHYARYRVPLLIERDRMKAEQQRYFTRGTRR